MEWSEVLDPELEPREVLEEKIPALRRARINQFRQFVKTDLIFCFEFTDSGDKFTVLVGPDEARVEAGEMIDFPQATAQGTKATWRRSLKLAARLVEPADEQLERHQGRLQVTEDLKVGFERFDGVLDVEVTELPDGDPPLTFAVILNDYAEPARARRAQLSVEWSVLVELANGRLEPAEAGRKVAIKGAMGLGLDIGGFFMKEFDL